MSDKSTYADLLAASPWHVRLRYWLFLNVISPFGWWVMPEPFRKMSRVIWAAKFGEFKAAADRIVKCEENGAAP